MSNQNHLVKGTKPYQYYFFRCIIPKDLRSILGKSQIRISLKNSDYCNSKIIAKSLYIVSKNLFDELRLDPMKNITIKDVKDILRIEVRKSLLHIHHYQYGTNVFSKDKINESISKTINEEERLRDRLEKDYQDTLGVIEREIDKILITLDLDPNKESVEYKGLVRRWIELKLMRQDWKRDLLNESGRNDEDFKKEIEEKWRLSLWDNVDDMILPPIIEGEDIPDPTQPYLTQSNSIEVKYNKVESSPSPLFSEVFPKHLDQLRRNKMREQTIKETQQTYEDVIELIGDKPISEYSNIDGRDYRTSIISLPRNRKKIKKYRDFNLHELLKMNVPEEDRLSGDTQTKLISRMTSLWNFLIDEYPEFVNQNVFKKNSVTISTRKAKDKRESFTDEDIKTIFHHKNYLPSIFEANLNQKIKFPYYWIPILDCLMGAKLEEICQMRVKDIKKVNGIWVYRIREEGDYGSEVTKVKNPYSERDIPLHSEIVNTLGFVNYVKHIKKLGKERTFWELPKRGDVYHKNVGKFFNQKYLVKIGLKKKGKSFHSLRHSVETNLTNANVNGRFIDFLQGHSQKGVGGSVYMKGIKPDVLLNDCIEKLIWDVDWAKLKVKW